jgi:hypothetical protein
VYALEVARRLIYDPNLAQIKGLTLVAPFVSTSCKHSWKIARLGNWVPSLVLTCATKTIAFGEPLFLSMFLSESALKKLVSEEEQALFGWNDSDFKDIVDTLPVVGKVTANAKVTEAQLGANSMWQQVCDDFAVESGCGLVVEDGEETTKSPNQQGTVPSFPIVIHACRKDTIAPCAAVEWLARRCYGNSTIIIHDEIHSHEVMTFLGGPPRNPGLLHAIARDWELLE